MSEEEKGKGDLEEKETIVRVGGGLPTPPGYDTNAATFPPPPGDETKTPPTHYFTTTTDNGINTFKIDVFDSTNIPEGEVTFMCVDAHKEDPVQSIVDKDGNKTDDPIPNGLQDAVKGVLNSSATGGADAAAADAAAGAGAGADTSASTEILIGNAEIVKDASTIKPGDGKEYYIVIGNEAFKYNHDATGDDKKGELVADEILKKKLFDTVNASPKEQAGGRRRSRRNRRQNGKRQSKKRQQNRQSKKQKQNGGKKRRNSKRNQKK